MDLHSAGGGVCQVDVLARLGRRAPRSERRELQRGLRGWAKPPAAQERAGPTSDFTHALCLVCTLRSRRCDRRWRDSTIRLMGWASINPMTDCALDPLLNLCDGARAL
jgi:hypothetical protein